MYIVDMLDLILIDKPRNLDNLSFIREPAFTEGVDLKSISDGYLQDERTSGNSK